MARAGVRDYARLPVVEVSCRSLRAAQAGAIRGQRCYQLAPFPQPLLLWWRGPKKVREGAAHLAFGPRKTVPDLWVSVRIVPRSRQQMNPDRVRNVLVFVHPSASGARPEALVLHHPVVNVEYLLPAVQSRDSKCFADSSGELCLGLARDGMSQLVRHDACKLVFGLSIGHRLAGDKDPPAGQGKGIQAGQFE